MATESDTKVTNSPEYTAFQKCYESLIDTIAQECGGFCNSLFAKSFISTEIRDFTRLGPVTNKKKAEQLVDALADKIKHYPSIFHEFLKILKIQTPFADNLLEQLESLYEVANSSNKHSHSMHLDISQKVPSPEINKESFVFVCPHCRKCTLEEFICKRNCVKASEKNLFPYLDTPHLSLRDRHILEARLHSDTEKMVTLFAEIDTNIAGSLQANIPVLKNFILDLVSSYGHDNYVEKLEKAETIPEIFVALRPFKSFLNYQIVEKIVKKFGSKENQQDMQVYSNAFIDFCKRSAFEVPLNALSQCFGTNKMKVLSVKLVSKVEASLKDVVSSQQKIAAILGVNEWDLHIVSIEKGCVCLRFIVPAKFLFPLSQFQVNELDIMNIK